VRNQREHLEQVALFRWMWANRAKHPAFDLGFAIPNGGARHIAVARKLKAEGVKAGVPDIFIPWPSGKSHGFFVEMKSEKGVVSGSQDVYMQSLLNVGYAVEVCRSWIEAAELICDYLGLDRKGCGL
jgi:hypothetical protein